MISDTDWALLDARLNEIERSIGILQAYVDTSLKEKYYGNSRAIGVAFTEVKPRPCVFDGMSKEDRMKPMCISCPCPKCSPYALSVGNFTDAGVSQAWSQPKALVDCISTTKIGGDNV